MKPSQIIGPHQPNKPNARIKRQQFAQQGGRVARAKTGLKISDFNARMRHYPPRHIQPSRHRGGAMGFEGVTGADQPPNTVQPKAAERFAGNMTQ